jgi:hydroxyacylglutathione hydrolase
MSKQAFIELVTADQPEAPPYFVYDAVLNSKERLTLDEALERELKPLTLDQLLAMQAEGAQILETRDPDEFGAAHLAGSIDIGLGGQYATWAGTVLDHTHPIVIIADPGRESESAIRLGRIGFDHIAGYLQNGLRSLEAPPTSSHSPSDSASNSPPNSSPQVIRPWLSMSAARVNAPKSTLKTASACR